MCYQRVDWFYPKLKESKEENTMKKIIGIVCAVALAATVAAGLCDDPCGELVTGCQQWFSLSAGGKVSRGSNKGSWKTVQGLKVKDCYFILGESTSTNSTSDAYVVINGTRGGKKFTETLECSEFTWNIFGKQLETMLAAGKKKGAVESEIAFTAANQDGTMEISGVLFGKVKATAKKSGCACGDADVIWTPGSFSGKFVGKSEITDCGCYEVMGFELGCEEKEVCGPCGETTETLRNCLKFTENADAVEYFCGDIKMKWNAKKSGCLGRLVKD